VRKQKVLRAEIVGGSALAKAKKRKQPFDRKNRKGRTIRGVRAGPTTNGREKSRLAGKSKLGA